MTADDQERKSLNCTKSLQEKEGEGGQPDSAVRTHKQKCMVEYVRHAKAFNGTRNMAAASNQTQDSCFELPEL